jgi:hypothetical protein
MWQNWQVVIVALVSFLSGVAAVLGAAIYVSSGDDGQRPPFRD